MADHGTTTSHSASDTSRAVHSAGHAGTTSNTTGGAAGTAPNHLGTDVPSGGLETHHDPEKTGHHGAGATETTGAKGGVPVDDDDDEVEDIDALIDDLESQDGAGVEEEEEEVEQGGARPVAEEMLATDPRVGLSESEVLTRRKKYGLNQMKEEKENLILKFLGYFVGPIQFVMEVSRPVQSPPSPT